MSAGSAGKPQDSRSFFCQKLPQHVGDEAMELELFLQSQSGPLSDRATWEFFVHVDCPETSWNLPTDPEKNGGQR